ncbi:uncharacterized protein LOC103704959 [Phoenix dactylifera]|uniref:Uncharacterized protein LOC103704959 n=1 Tax=Phoenix dactylifera TaxID=42345 RepID=A0A8B7BWC8_PHODC|nr:uncharacterized protein LOC103704959 [Phoenix dactylifera]
METEAKTSCTTVENVTRASSDELLRKFAELDADPPVRSSRPSVRLPIVRRNRSRRVMSGLAARDLATGGAETPSTRRRRSGGLAEWKALLPPTASSRRSASLLRRMGIGRSEIGPGDAVGLKLLLAALEKTWCKTMEGASKMFVEKHCNKHVRLISDIV